MKSGRAACRPIDWTLIFGSANAAVIRERRLPHTSVLVRTAEPSRPLISVYASWFCFLNLQVILNRKTPFWKSWSVFLFPSRVAPPGWVRSIVFLFLKIRMWGLKFIKRLLLSRTKSASSINVVPLWDRVARIQWYTVRLCATYLLAKVLNPAGASARLAQVNLSYVTSEWDNLNELERFVFTFPVDASQKRQTEGSSPSERIGSVVLTLLGYDIPGFNELINLFWVIGTFPKVETRERSGEINAPTPLSNNECKWEC